MLDKEDVVDDEDPPPDSWKLPLEGDEWRCIKGPPHPKFKTTQPCLKETCNYCGAAKRKERNFLRKVAQKDKKWADLDSTLFSKYIRFWRDQNTLDDDSLVIRTDQGNTKKEKDYTAEICRVIYQNVYEPPVAETVVKIPLLEPEISYEDIMDKVTAAMSADTFVVEVGEKTAMRRRLLNAWQMIRQLHVNARFQNFYRHLLQLVIIILTLLSVVSGVVTYTLDERLDLALCIRPLDFRDQGDVEMTCTFAPDFMGLHQDGVLRLAYALQVCSEL